jgi:hypothetical protein
LAHFCVKTHHKTKFDGQYFSPLKLAVLLTGCVRNRVNDVFSNFGQMYVFFPISIQRGQYFILIQCVRKIAVHLQNVLKVMSTSFYTGLKPFNVIRKHFLQICVRKVAVHLKKLLEVMSTSVYTGLNPFNL